MHMPGAGADGAIVPPVAMQAWQRLAVPTWPIPPEAFPPGTALVGGAVRDALLNRLGPQPDLDLVLPGDAVALCRQLRRQHGGSAVVLDAERSIARLVLNGWSIDLARQEGGSLCADLHRRDYTINAMALPLAQRDELVDPLGGADHLARGLLVAVSEANLLDDPLRLLRGLRLASELGFALEARSRAWIREHGARLGQVAGERVLAELEKLAAAPEGQRGLAELADGDLLAPWRTGPLAPCPWLEQLTPARAERLGLTRAEREQALPLARLAAVLDGPALQALRSSRRLQQRVERLRHWQRRLASSGDGLPELERLQLHRDLEHDLPALLLSWPSDTPSDTPSATAAWLARWRDAEDPLFHPRAAIDGNSLQRELQLQASPQLGALLEHLMLERAFGRLHGRDEALGAARRWLESAARNGRNAPRRD